MFFKKSMLFATARGSGENGQHFSSIFKKSMLFVTAEEAVKVANIKKFEHEYNLVLSVRSLVNLHELSRPYPALHNEL